MKFKLLNGYSFAITLSLLRVNVTSSLPYLSTIPQIFFRKDYGSTNYIASTSASAFVEDLSEVEMYGSSARIALQFYESMRNLICLGVQK